MSSTTTVSETASGPVLEMTRIIPASPNQVFAAWSDPNLIGKWFGPEGTHCESVEVDFRVGGHYRFACATSKGIFTVKGTYLEINEPTRLVFDWSWEHENTVRTTVEVSLRDADGGQTELTLKQSGFASTESAESHDHGWSGSFARMVSLFSN